MLDVPFNMLRRQDFTEDLRLVAGQPEVREYRMRFWDKGTPNGDWTPVQKQTVSP